jgi:N utilization substance protein B
VKVMQTLYVLVTLEQEVKEGEPLKLLQKHFDQSRELLVYLIYFFTEIAAYAEKDAHQRSSKHLPTAEDLNVNIKIAGNEVIWKIKEDATYQAEVKKERPEQYIDKDLVRKFYHLFVETAEYKKYASTPSRSFKEEREIVNFLFEGLLLPNELFISHLEENFINWDDDADMVAPDKWEFAKSLLHSVLEKSEHLESLIIPRLKNWDAERIALLDMIIMKMGVAEFLYFETIPPKVTINEYIDIAKEYSTQQSGQFVNGILDNIHKDLQQQGKLHKIDFRKA